MPLPAWMPRVRWRVATSTAPCPGSPAHTISPAIPCPAQSLMHLMGLYYIQEPSAMAAGAALAVKPGMRVLDLCAAPGGKSSQLAAALAGKGLLVSNEPIPARARMLAGNIERQGFTNVVVTNEYPDRLAARWGEAFDAITGGRAVLGRGHVPARRKARCTSGRPTRPAPVICVSSTYWTVRTRCSSPAARWSTRPARSTGWRMRAQ